MFIESHDTKTIARKSSELMDFCLKNSEYVVLRRYFEGGAELFD